MSVRSSNTTQEIQESLVLCLQMPSLWHSSWQSATAAPNSSNHLYRCDPFGTAVGSLCNSDLQSVQQQHQTVLITFTDVLPLAQQLGVCAAATPVCSSHLYRCTPSALVLSLWSRLASTNVFKHYKPMLPTGQAIYPLLPHQYEIVSIFRWHCRTECIWSLHYTVHSFYQGTPCRRTVQRLMTPQALQCSFLWQKNPSVLVCLACSQMSTDWLYWAQSILVGKVI